MTRVGIRELRNNLSKYLERVRGGEEVIVTDRGTAVARVLPVGTERVLDRLIAEGAVTPAPQPKRRTGAPTKATGISPQPTEFVTPSSSLSPGTGHSSLPRQPRGLRPRR